MITDPGVYELSSDEYHADDALSSSGARKLLPPYCPALFRWHRDHQQAPSRVFEFGHAAHRVVLGEGHDLVAIDADSYRTKAAQEARDDARASGKVPLLPDELETVLAMAAVLQRHPAAALIRVPGRAEQSLFAKDEATGVMLRARIDWLPEVVDGRMTIVDLKTTVSAEPAAFARSVARFGYFAQADWYSAIVLALGLADEVEFQFIAQEKTAPYLVSVFTLDAYSLAIGRKRNRKAIDLFARCVERDDWPSYVAGVKEITVPVWADDEEEIVIS